MEPELQITIMNTDVIPLITLDREHREVIKAAVVNRDYSSN